jgi:D-alanyl-D-alanine carboxypeptidase
MESRKFRLPRYRDMASMINRNLTRNLNRGVAAIFWRRFVSTVPTMVIAISIVIATTGPSQANPRYAAFVMDAASGEVLHARYADKHLFPASLTKMMTLYMLFQSIDRGEMTLDQRIPISRNAAAEPPSKLGIPAGGSIRVQDAIYSLVTRSANDIATAVGEALGGSETRFAQLMTQEARRLGMSNTTFRNAHGLPNSQQISTARDMGTLSQALMRDFPQEAGLTTVRPTAITII